MNKKRVKPYVVAGVLTVLYVVEIFWLSDVLGSNLGIGGTVLHEVVLALIGIMVFVIMRGKLKKIFPLKRPEFKKLSGRSYGCQSGDGRSYNGTSDSCVAFGCCCNTGNL